LKDVVIMGGGISGLCSAYYLLKEGFKVTVIDKGDLTQGASNINAGYIAPSHIISLASPGVINKGLKWMWNSSSPFYIKPTLNLDFLSWAWKFKRSATNLKVEQAIPVLKEINIRSRDLYEEMLGSVDFKFHYEKKGLLTIYKTAKARDEEIRKAERIKAEDLETEILSRKELLKLEPGLQDDVFGGVHYICDSHSTPGDFIQKLTHWLENNGVDFRLNETVKEIIGLNGRISEVRTDKGSYHANAFVLATGSWTQQLSKEIGLKIPLQGGKGYSIDVYRDTGIKIPTILAESKVAITPMQGFTRIAGTMEFSGNNNFIRKERVAAIAKAVPLYYKDLEINSEEKEAARSGLRPVSPDGLPYIGTTAKYNNLVVATGHAMIGYSLGAVTGKLISQLVAGQKPSVDLAPFKPERFN